VQSSGLITSANLPLPAAIALQRYQLSAMRKHALQYGVSNAQPHLTLSEELAGLVAPAPRGSPEPVPMMEMSAYI